MSHTLRPADVHDLLLDLERAVVDALGESLPSSATTYASFDCRRLASSSTGGPSGGTNANRARRMSVRARVESMGSLPPMPPTVRGRAGRALVSFTNRLTWWQSAQARQVAAELVDAVEGVASEVLDLGARRQELAGRVAQLESRVERLSQLAPRIEELERSIAEQEDQELMEEFYIFHQERFRGAREEIIERLGFYLPTIEQSPVAQTQRLALDLGCGRGEWLQLLQQKNWRGCGVDTNARSIELCRALDLEVVKADAIQYLTEVADGELGAVTAFHLVEHLRFPQVIRLFRHVARSLATGGVLILETPDPANHVVANWTFYLEPSHIARLPSDLLHVVLEFTGFRDIRVVHLHPDERGEEEPGGVTGASIGRDYGIIAFKG